jgi:hypothetical protein
MRFELTCACGYRLTSPNVPDIITRANAHIEHARSIQGPNPVPRHIFTVARPQLCRRHDADGCLVPHACR